MSNASINFNELLKQMCTARQSVGQPRPVIYGGHFAHSDLAKFLAEWEPNWAQMRYRIWEQINEIGFHDKPKERDFLQRAEVFGTGGHLSLRRDGNRWLWHFIGPVDTPVGSNWAAEPFWNEKHLQKVELRRYTESVILWGEAIVDNQQKKTGVWWEDRVGAARLNYPDELKEHARVYLHYWRYTEGGQTAFVWYRELNGKAASHE
jgi:hypothetical protein